MREIKFRAKRIDNAEWVNGSGLLVADDFCVIDTDTEMYEDEKYEWAGATHFYRVAGAKCDKETICQFTGLKDKNGQEIYEGDILSFGWIEDHDYIVVRFVRGVFAFLWNDNLDDECVTQAPTHEWAEVIGNVYDDENLLKQ